MALIGMAATGAIFPANAARGVAGMQGIVAPLDDPDPGVPTGLADPLCVTMPGDAVCAGGPFAPPAPPVMADTQRMVSYAASQPLSGCQNRR